MTEKKIKCAFCDIIQGKKPHEVIITENEKFLVIPDRDPSSKGHSLLVTRDHLPHLAGMSQADWNEILPLFKDIIGRMDNLSPVGFNCYMWCGREEGAGGSLQSVPHFHINIVPIYQKEYGLNWFVTRIKRENDTDVSPTSQDYQETTEKFQPNSEGVIKETSKLTVALASAEQALIPGHLIIKSKENIPNNLKQVDAETWSQIGELLQECLQELRQKFPVKNIQVEFSLGKLSGPEQQDVSELQLHILPFQEENYSYQNPEQKSREYLRIARKLKGVAIENVVSEQQAQIVQKETIISDFGKK